MQIFGGAELKHMFHFRVKKKKKERSIRDR